MGWGVSVGGVGWGGGECVGDEGVLVGSGREC